MNRVAHFEIQAKDPEELAVFYREVFGWTITKWEGGTMEYWMVTTAPKESTALGINGRLVRRDKEVPAGAQEGGYNTVVCTVDVENFDEMEQKILRAGGVVAQEKFHPRHERVARNIFLWCCRVKRGSGGTIYSTSGFYWKKVWIVFKRHSKYDLC